MRDSRARQLAAGVAAGPLFIAAFTALGAARSGYDWRRHPVSSLACGRRGWLQRANFIVTGVLYGAAARGLWRVPDRGVECRAVPALVGAAGVGLIGSGLFVTDPVAGFPPEIAGQGETEQPRVISAVPSREGILHNVSAIPIFVGIPAAGLVSAFAAARQHDHRWAGYSAASSLTMAGSFVLFSAALGGSARLVGRGGLFQRLSIASGFGWVTVLSLRTLRSPPAAG